jgi:hypothetical protein
VNFSATSFAKNAVLICLSLKKNSHQRFGILNFIYNFIPELKALFKSSKKRTVSITGPWKQKLGN